jgi:hypothetical protein
MGVWRHFHEGSNFWILTLFGSGYAGLGKSYSPLSFDLTRAVPDQLQRPRPKEAFLATCTLHSRDRRERFLPEALHMYRPVRPFLSVDRRRYPP